MRSSVMPCNLRELADAPKTENERMRGKRVSFLALSESRSKTSTNTIVQHAPCLLHAAHVLGHIAMMNVFRPCLGKKIDRKIGAEKENSALESQDTLSFTVYPRPPC